ncbi:Rhophilin, Rho GTPase binding protein [Chytriomyces hyalinus]|nr:Rhophilin, Rho GTPase binding protein [Chytriomyces hyalinus]
MDSTNKLAAAPFSFHHLFEVAHPSQIPFNHGPCIAFNAEAQKFVSFPTKRNAVLLVNEGSAQSGAGQMLRALAALSASPPKRHASIPHLNQAQAPRSGVDLVSAEKEGSFDFERVLTPVMTEMLANTQQTANNANSSPALNQSASVGDFGSRRRPIDYKLEEQRRILLQFPTPSQWSTINSLRTHAGSPERSSDGIEKLMQYYAQLLRINEKLDLNSKKLQQSFTWYEAFSTERLVMSPCIHFEMAAVLFNVAAIYSQLGCAQNLWTKDGKKIAADYFKKAAGIFIHVRDTHAKRIAVRLDKTSDLTDMFLTAASQIMSSQAMECFFDKANEDKKSSSIMSKIAAQTADYYDLALKYSKEGLHILTKQRVPKLWLNQLTSKAYLYAAIAHFHAPLLLNAEQSLGERVARLSMARNLANRALKLSKDAGTPIQDIVKSYLDVLTSAYLLADAANYETHNHPNIDATLVSALARPMEALVHPVSASEVLGDLGRFADVLAAYQPQHADADVADHAVRAVEVTYKELECCKKEIDSRIKANSGLQNVSLKLILDENKKRAKAVSEALELIQAEESDTTLRSVLHQLEELHTSINQMHIECTTILDTSKPAAADTPLKKLFDAICTALHQETLILEPHAKELRDAETKFRSDTITNFHPLEWTHENLLAILPCLKESRVLEIDDLVHEKKREILRKDVAGILQALQPLSAECTKKMNELINFVECMEATRDASVLHSQKLRLHLIEEAANSIKHDMNTNMKLLGKISSEVSTASPKRHVEEQSRATIESFEKQIAAYNKLRSTISSETGECSRIKTETELILKACLSLKQPPNDGNASEQAITLLIKSQSEFLKAAREMELNVAANSKPAPLKHAQNETNILADIKHRLERMKEAGHKSNPDIDEFMHLLSKLLKQQNEVDTKATDTKSTLEFLKKFLSTASSPPAKQEPKISASEKAAQDLRKFQDELHALAVAQQQEVLRLSRSKQEKMLEAKSAEAEEMHRRAEIERLGAEAWKVLSSASMIHTATAINNSNSTHGGPRLPSNVYRHPKGGQSGQSRKGHSQGNPFDLLGHQNAELPGFKHSSQFRRPSTGKKDGGDSDGPDDFYDGEDFMKEAQSEAESVVEKQELEVLHAVSHMVDSCAKNRKLHEDQAEHFKNLEVRAREREEVIAKGCEERRRDRIASRRSHSNPGNLGVPENHGFLHGLLNMDLFHLGGRTQDTTPRNNPTHHQTPASEEKNIMNWLRSQTDPENPPSAAQLREFLAYQSDRQANAAANADRVQARRQSVNTFAGGPTVMAVSVPEVVLPQKTNEADSVPAILKKKTFAEPARFNFNFGGKGSDPAKCENTEAKVFGRLAQNVSENLSDHEPTAVVGNRKPVDRTKPGMVNKGVQEPDAERVVHATNHGKGRKMKKRDSGVGGVSSSSEGSNTDLLVKQNGRKHGNLARVKFDNDMIVQHFGGSIPKN